ncbi:MAG: serine hydrolase [Bacteroidota bacterium]|nr:serine hydrolase [Bacteroidota bacterium]
MFKKVFPCFLLCIIAIFPLFAQRIYKNIDYKKQEIWADSVFAKLTDDQKIGQLFMVAAYSNKDEKHYKDIENIINNYHIGGLIFFQGGPLRQAHLTNRYQKLAKTPLFIGMDGECGLGMRLDSTISYPKAMTLGAIENNQYIYNMGAEIARQFTLMGVHINFGPVVDVNNNAKNPIIGNRSFGENKYNVAAKGIAYMKGMQDNGIIASAKHFPGHGDTHEDSHHTLPIVKHSAERLKEVELYPFAKLVQDSLLSIMVGHIQLPTLEPRNNTPASLSKNIVTGLLKEEMGFEGLIFTDALNMKGVTKYHKPGEIELKALIAGNDVLLFPENLPLAINNIKLALKTGTLTMEDIDLKVKKILRAKYWAGLHKNQPIITDNLYTKLNGPMAVLAKQKLFEQSVTVVKSKPDLLPFQILDTATFASLSIGAEGPDDFQEYLGYYAIFNNYIVPKNVSDMSYYTDMKKTLSHYKVVIVNFHGINNATYRESDAFKSNLILLKSLEPLTNLVISIFGSPYHLSYFEGFENVILSYEDEAISRKLVPQMLFGGLPFKGKLPVTASTSYVEGIGVKTEALDRLTYSLPEDVGLDSRVLTKIDKVVKDAILDKTFPGCQVLVARKGEVVLNQSYGHLTYDKERPVTNNTIYDIASVTKVAATLQAIMFLEEKEMINLNDKVSKYLPELINSNKKDITIKDVLLHQAGLQPYIPFWQRTVDKMGLMASFYSISQELNFDRQLTPGIFALNSMQDSVWRWSIESNLMDKKKKNTYDYKYSDIGFYILKQLAEELLNQPLNEFLNQNLYNPLGLATMTYLPLCKYPEEIIAPTENDQYFRNSLICGTVHDQGAAMFGGIAGHAGIFSNANDLAILMQMHLQNGAYGGTRYYLERTVPKFSSKQRADNRRGLGWDKPIVGETGGPTSHYASPKTFGHTGFTGTAVWVDPEFELVYIFLSNRVYPDANNVKLMKNNIRSKIQDLIYESIWSFEKTQL